MPNERAERLAELVKAALELAPAERTAFLETACADDPALRAETSALLGPAEEDDDFLEGQALHLVAETLAEEEPSRIGESLGDYRLVALLGAGGMGEVYLAEDAELGRQVAIKLIHRGFGGVGVARHLRREARILAGLTDSHIARLYGVAATPAGVPYFVMEYVAGKRLDEYCTEHQLTTDARLELFQKVCAGVSYAHRHLIIHRDLKPANIRVTAEGEPKLLDFGIAKLLDPESTETFEQTLTLAGVMTPDYASPEQVAGDGAMTTASDVYSLGVILYELLTGEKPYRLTSRQPAEMARAIAAQEPPRPSALRPGLHRDLDNIVLMALRKEPARRYASVAQFADDLRRHRAGLPVTARKDTLGYRAGKFVRRHKAAVATAALVALALVAGLIATTWQARVARQERDRAQIATRQAERLNLFLEDLLSSADPSKMGKDVKVVQVLDAGGKSLEADLADEPELLARAHETLGRAYQNLGLWEQAEQHARAALILIRRLHGTEDPATAHAEYALADVLADRYRSGEAQPLLRHALAVFRRQPVPNEKDLAETLDVLSFTYVTENRPAEADPLAEEAIRHAHAAWGEENQNYLDTLVSLGNIKAARRDYLAAAAIYGRLITLNDRLDPTGVGSIAPQLNLCIALINLERFAELEPVVKRLESDTRRLYGEDGTYFAMAVAVRGCLDFAQGKDQAAIPCLRQALNTLAVSYPPGQTTVVQARALLGLCLTRTGHAAEGEPLLRQALADGGKVDRADFNHTIGNLETALGECLFAQDRYAEAEPLLLTGYSDLQARLGAKSAQAVNAAERLERLYLAWNKPSRAAQFARVDHSTR